MRKNKLIIKENNVKEMRTFREQNNLHVKWGIKKDNMIFPCFAFADDIPLLLETKEEAIKQVEDLKEIAEKAGLQIRVSQKNRSRFF